jgi:hypothetical protein
LPIFIGPTANGSTALTKIAESNCLLTAYRAQDLADFVADATLAFRQLSRGLAVNSVTTEPPSIQLGKLPRAAGSAGQVEYRLA